MTLLVLFCLSAGLFWMLTFGYCGVLLFLSRGTRRYLPVLPDDAPSLTVIVPILNEERFVVDKLNDLQRTRYAPNRLRILLVDGGSTDRSVEYANQVEARTWPIDVMHVYGARGKVDQVNVALKNVSTEYVVLNDVDTTLEPGCISELVAELVNDPTLGIIGAHVIPVTPLEEEKLHWKIVNRLWHLEGEAFGAAGVSGVCHAMRLSVFGADRGVHFAAEDIELTMVTVQNGFRARTCPRAMAYEHRVPHSTAQVLEFRSRRSRDYREVLNSFRPREDERRLNRVMRLVRRSQMTAAPLLGLMISFAGLALLATGAWVAVTLVLCAFTLSSAIWLRRFVGVEPDRSGIATFAGWCRMTASTLFGLLRPSASGRSCAGAKETIGRSST